MKSVLKLFLPIIVILAVSFISTAQPAGTYISEDAQEACVKYGEEYGICPELLMAIIERESAGQADAENGGARD